MGCHMSKKPRETSSAINTLAAGGELRSHETACKIDSDLQAGTDHQVINTLAAGVELRSLSLDSLKQVMECLLEMNQEVVKVILDCKKDICKSQELFELVEEFFENSLQTLDSCIALEDFLKRVRESQLLVLSVLQQFEEETGLGENLYVRTLQELKNFKAAGNTFSEEFFQIHQSVYNMQIIMLEKLQLRKKKNDKKVKQVRIWRKISCTIFAAAVAAVLIGSVVAAAIASPHVAAAVSPVTAIPIGSMGKWIDSRLQNYENAMKGLKEVSISMHVGTYVAIKDLDNIRVLINRLEDEIESLQKNVNFAIEEEDAVMVAIEEIRKKFGIFIKNVDDLGVQADMCSREIRRAKTVILQKIMKLPQN